MIHHLTCQIISWEEVPRCYITTIHDLLLLSKSANFRSPLVPLYLYQPKDRESSKRDLKWVSEIQILDGSTVQCDFHHTLFHNLDSAIWCKQFLKHLGAQPVALSANPKPEKNSGVSECLEYLSDYKLLSMHFCTTPTLKIQVDDTSQLYPSLLFPGNVLQTWRLAEIPNQTLQVKRWLKEPAKLSEFDSLIYMSFHKQTLLESRSQTCDGSTCYFAADLSKDWQEENNQQHTICINMYPSGKWNTFNSSMFVCFIKSRDGRLRRKLVPPTAVLKRDRLEQAAEGPKPHGEAAHFINVGSSWTPSFCCNCCSSCWHHSSRQLNHTVSK